MRALTISLLFAVGLLACLTSAHIRGSIMKQHHQGRYAPYVLEAFEKFKTKYNRVYASPKEEEYRLGVFNDFLIRVKAIADAGTDTFTVGITKFADMTREEFKAKMIGGYNRTRTGNVKEVDTSKLGASIDWIERGAVTPVIDQGHCGASPYQSAIANMEGLNFLKTGTLVTLSTQQVIDCSDRYGNDGCIGGTMENTIRYAIDFGLESDEDYPFAGIDRNCSWEPTKVVAMPKDLAELAINNQDALATALMESPISGAVQASSDIFQAYTGGIITSPDCGTQIDHGVGVVGFDSTASTPYFKLKNSWGSDWGEGGFVRVAYQVGQKGPGVCGVAVDNWTAIF